MSKKKIKNSHAREKRKIRCASKDVTEKRRGLPGRINGGDPFHGFGLNLGSMYGWKRRAKVERQRPEHGQSYVESSSNKKKGYARGIASA